MELDPKSVFGDEIFVTLSSGLARCIVADPQMTVDTRRPRSQRPLSPYRHTRSATMIPLSRTWM